MEKLDDHTHCVFTSSDSSFRYGKERQNELVLPRNRGLESSIQIRINLKRIDTCFSRCRFKQNNVNETQCLYGGRPEDVASQKSKIRQYSDSLSVFCQWKIIKVGYERTRESFFVMSYPAYSICGKTFNDGQVRQDSEVIVLADGLEVHDYRLRVSKEPFSPFFLFAAPQPMKSSTEIASRTIGICVGSGKILSAIDQQAVQRLG